MMEKIVNFFKSKMRKEHPKDVLSAAAKPATETMLRVRHEWNLVGRSYAPPTRNIPQQLTDAVQLERAMFGVTTLLFIDQISGELRKEELIGSDENQLETMLDKADNYGIQYIPYNNKRFAIAMVPSDETLPVK